MYFSCKKYLLVLVFPSNGATDWLTDWLTYQSTGRQSDKWSVSQITKRQTFWNERQRLLKKHRRWYMLSYFFSIGLNIMLRHHYISLMVAYPTFAINTYLVTSLFDTCKKDENELLSGPKILYKQSLKSTWTTFKTVFWSYSRLNIFSS